MRWGRVIVRTPTIACEERAFAVPPAASLAAGFHAISATTTGSCLIQGRSWPTRPGLSGLRKHRPFADGVSRGGPHCELIGIVGSGREIGDKDKWELYSLDDDFSEAKNLAAKNPEKLAELKRLFNEKAKSIPSRRGAFVRAQALAGRLRSEAHEIRVLRRRFQACGDRRTNTKNCSHSITTVIEMPKTGGEGVIVAEGSKSAGFACTCRTANSYTVTIGSSGN